MSVTHYVVLNVDKDKVRLDQRVHVRCGDVSSQVVRCALQSGGASWTPAAGSTAKLEILKPDGTWTVTNASISGSNVSGTVPAAAMSAPGECKRAYFRIINGSAEDTTEDFYLYVYPNATQDAIESSSYSDEFKALLEASDAELAEVIEDVHTLMTGDMLRYNRFSSEGSTQGIYLKTNGGFNNSSMGSVSGFLPVLAGCKVTVDPGPVPNDVWAICFYDADKVLLSGESLIQLEFTAPANAAYVRFTYVDSYVNEVFYVLGEVQSEILKFELENKAKLSKSPVPVEWEIGGYNNLSRNTNTNQVRSTGFYRAKAGTSVSMHLPEARYKMSIIAGDSSWTYIPQASAKIQYPVYDAVASIPSEYLNENMSIRFVLTRNDDNPMTEEDLEWIRDNIVISGLEENSQRMVYKFNDDGHGWCFVYTPQNYDSKRSTPYPFVICNHGNGWTIGNNANSANWTKRTMYVPMDDADYQANPDQYNGTTDKLLWYSNPTIEALLAAGYVVCGAQNYGDALYGNNDNRRACVEFFHHMIKNYNVEGRCCMIGASNGAQTSINASYLLGEKVKAMILQYPLTCLVSHYMDYANHRSAIRNAYGIDDASIDEEGLIAATATHDLLHTNVVNNTKVGYFPPTRMYYSLSDNTTRATANTLKAYQLLNDSLKDVEKVECSGAHGDYSHFNPAQYVDFFNRY